MGKKQANIFISYSRKDEKQVEFLIKHLLSEFGSEQVFFDKKDKQLTDNY